MSFSDAIGHIDQIVQWEQQLANPAALAQTTSSGGTASTANTSTTTTAAGSSFANALAQAQGGSTAASVLDPAGASGATGSAVLGGGNSQLLAALASTGSSAVGGPAAGAAGSTLSALESGLAGGGGAGAAAVPALAVGSAAGPSAATSPADPRITAMVQEANSLVGKPYIWGGGHSGWGPQAGYDCSGFVSAVLHAGGYLSSPADTTTLPSQPGIEQGPGQYVTIYDRDGAGENGHVIIDIGGQFYESGGEQGTWGGGGGVARISTPSAQYLATFNQVLHPAGL